MKETKYAHNEVDLSQANTTWVKMTATTPQGATVLDVGCSSGYLGETLIKERGATVFGVEINAEDAKIAKSRGFAEVFQADIEGFDWKRLGSHRFDTIIFADVLEHLREPELVLQKASAYLNKGGKVLISVPNIAHISVRLELLNGSFVYEPTGILDNTHTKYFTKATVQKLVQDGGLKVERLDASLDDIPDDLIESKLQDVGLKPTEEFMKIANSDEARTFQYIVTASQEGGRTATVKLPPKILRSFHDLRVRAYRNDQSRESLLNDIADKEKEVAKLVGQINQITSSKRWKLASFLGQMVSFFRGK